MPTPSPISGLAQSVGAATRGSSEADRNAWLRVMEREGLQDALSKTRHFSLGEGRDAREDAPNDAHGRVRAQTTQEESGRLDAKASNGTSGRTNPGIEAPPPASGAYAQMRTRSEGEAVPIGGAFERAQEGYRVALSRKNDATSRAPAQTTGLWEKTNVAVLGGTNDAEVWIRDASIDPAGERALLGRVKEALANLGARLKRFTVNGKAVFVTPVGSDGFKRTQEK